MKKKGLFSVGKISLVVLAFFMCIVAMNPVPVKADVQKQTNSYDNNVCLVGMPQIATDYSKFPDVQLNMRIVDNHYDPISAINSSDIQIKENNSTPVYAKNVSSGISSGADFFFVLDSGNHTDPMVVKKVLGAFYDIMQEGNDSVTIINDENSSYTYVAKNITSKDKLNEIIHNLSDDRNKDFYTIYSAFDQTLKDVDRNRYECSRPLFIVAVTGDLSFDKPEKRGYNYSASIASLPGKLLFIHNGSSTNLEYKNFTQNVNGQYIDIPSSDQTSELVRLVNSLSGYRTTYTVSYRSNNGTSGEHKIGVLYQGQDLNVYGTDSFSVQLDPPTITLTPQDNNILRVATRRTEEGYIFNQDSEFININIDWKGFPREVTAAKLIVNDGSPLDVQVEKISESQYRIPWNMSDLDQKGVFTVKLTIVLYDELNENVDSRTMTGETSINLTNRVPASLMTTWLLYGLYILLGLMIIAFFIWRKKITSSIVKGGKSVGEAIRKTIVGNRNSRKSPIAGLEIIDGPNNILGKELPIYSESVNLGRDPAKSDLTFYGPDSVTSVSGLHCKIQHTSSGWQITAISTSRSETFVDDQPIPFLTPVALNDGQRVRMGYYAQQPVEFVFHQKEISSFSSPISDPRKTNALSADAIGMKSPSFLPSQETMNGFQNQTSTRFDSPQQPPTPPTPPPFSGQQENTLRPPVFHKPDNDRKDGSVFDEFR